MPHPSTACCRCQRPLWCQATTRAPCTCGTHGRQALTRKLLVIPHANCVAARPTSCTAPCLLYGQLSPVQADPTARLDAHTDYVADLALAAGEQCLLAVSGDGTLSVTDLRTGKASARPVQSLGGRHG